MPTTDPSAVDPGARDEGREALLKATQSPPVKKKRRWILKTLVVLTLLLAALIGAAPMILSTAPVRRKIEASIKDATGRKATIGDHGIGWTSPITMSDFVLYERDGTTPMLKIASMSVKVDLKPLTDNQVILRTFEMSGVEVRIVRRKDGTLSTDELSQDVEKQSAKGGAKPSEPGKPMTFTMGTATIRDVTLTYVDEGAGKTWRVFGLTVNAKPGSSPDEIVTALAGKVELVGTPAGSIDGEATLLALASGKPRDEITGKMSIRWSGFDVAAISNSMSPMEGVDWTTGLVQGSVTATMLAGGDIQAALQTNLPAFKWADIGQVPAMVTPVDVKQEFVYHKALNSLELKTGGKIRLAGADIEPSGSIALGDGPHSGENPIDVIAVFDADTGALRTLFPSSMADQDTKGTLRSTWTIKGRNFDALSIAGVATLTGPWIYRSHAEDGTISEYLIPHPGDLRLQVKSHLDFLRREQRAKAEPGRAWASMDGLTAEIKLSAPWVRSKEMDIKQLAIEMTVNEQEVALQRLNFFLNDGRVLCDGRASLTSEEPEWHFHTAVGDPPVAYSTGFSGLAALINPALYSDQQGQVEAKMGWHIDLDGRGFSMDAMTRSLTGKGTLELRSGSLAGSPMLGQLFSALKLEGAPKYSFAGMQQEFHISDGTVYNDFSNWQGDKEANITIKGETKFDGTMKQTILVTGNAEARWGKTTGKIVEVFNKAGGIPLGGTVSDPKIAIDYEKALTGVASGILEDPEVQKKAKELFDDLFNKKKKKK